MSIKKILLICSILLSFLLTGEVSVYANQYSHEENMRQFEAARARHEETVRRGNETAKKVANDTVEVFLFAAREYGIDQAFSNIQNNTYREGYEGRYYEQDGVRYFELSCPAMPGLVSDSVIALWEYSYNPSANLLRVIYMVPELELRAVAIREFIPIGNARQFNQNGAVPILSGYRKRLMKPNDAKTLIEYFFGGEISARKEKFKSSSGYRVIAVDRSGIFDFNKIQKGDIIVGIGNQGLRDVKNIDELGSIINAVPVGSVTQFSIIRNGEKKIIPFKMYDPRECITE